MLSGCDESEVDPEKAVALLQKLVKRKDPEAMWMLGLCCEYGMGTMQDKERAFSLYKRSNDKGSRIGSHFAESRGERSGVLRGLSV